MSLKLDENLGPRSAKLIREDGHDVETVLGEGLGGSNDGIIYNVCIKQRRCLVTLDLDFADVVRFPPRGTSGIVVFRF